MSETLNWTACNGLWWMGKAAPASSTIYHDTAGERSPGTSHEPRKPQTGPWCVGQGTCMGTVL